MCKEKTRPEDIDNIICAELPDPKADPELFDIVKTQMVHGPCGNLNRNSPCMENGKCTKRFPKDLLQETQTARDGYPFYRRRKPEDGGFTTKMKIRGGRELEVNNSWIIPYNKVLSKTFRAHINIESCNSVKSIKYICKYVNKGSDMAVFGVEQDGAVSDEVKQFQMGRYISSNEAMWRILAFDIHQRYPTVTNLSVHLENGQGVFFTEENAHQVLEQPPDTTLTAFLKLCQQDPFARTLLYGDITSHYTWANKTWSQRKTGAMVKEWEEDDIRRSEAIGLVYTVHPKQQVLPAPAPAHCQRTQIL